MNILHFPAMKWGIVAFIAGIVLVLLSALSAPGLIYIGAAANIGGAISMAVGGIQMMVRRPKR